MPLRPRALVSGRYSDKHHHHLVWHPRRSHGQVERHSGQACRARTSIQAQTVPVPRQGVGDSQQIIIVADTTECRLTVAGYNARGLQFLCRNRCDGVTTWILTHILYHLPRFLSLSFHSCSFTGWHIPVQRARASARTHTFTHTHARAHTHSQSKPLETEMTLSVMPSGEIFTLAFFLIGLKMRLRLISSGSWIDKNDQN